MHAIARIWLVDYYGRVVTANDPQWKPKKNIKKISQYQAKTFCPDQHPPPPPPHTHTLHGPITALLDQFWSNFGPRRGNKFWTKSQSFKSLRQTVNPRTAGGRLSAPPPGFSQIAKNAIAVQPTIWHISKKNDDPLTPKVTPPGNIKWPDLKLHFSKFDVPKAHQWSEHFETRSVQ